MTSENGKREMFAGLPRRGGFGGWVTGALALIICGAFLTDVVPTRSSEDWLYDLEARRDQLARAYQARELAAQPERRAARATPGQRARPTALAALSVGAADHETAAPVPAATVRSRCMAAPE